MKLNDFIWIKRNVLSEEFCQHCIEKFEKDDNKHQGLVRSGVKLDTKVSTDLQISESDDWKEEDNTISHDNQEKETIDGEELEEIRKRLEGLL